MVARWWKTTTRWSVAPLVTATVLSVSAAAPAVAKPAEQANAVVATAEPQVLKPEAFAVSEPVTDIAKKAAATGGAVVKAPRPPETGPAVKDNGFQAEPATAPDQISIDVAMPAPTLTFNGITNACG